MQTLALQFDTVWIANARTMMPFSNARVVDALDITVRGQGSVQKHSRSCDEIRSLASQLEGISKFSSDSEARAESQIMASRKKDCCGCDKRQRGCMHGNFVSALMLLHHV